MTTKTRKDMPSTDCLTQWIHTACVLEAAAPKPGNVHPGASFEDLRFADFVRAAEVAAPILAQSPELGIGATVLAAVQSTREQIGTNANLGIVLLIAPLAAVPLQEGLRAGVGRVLSRMTRRDAELVYEAIRMARPGGMGEVPEQDVARPPTVSLLEAMRLAADRDLIARQYATDFALVLDDGVKILVQEVESRHRPGESTAPARSTWEQAIVELQLRLLSRHRDSLIERKCGVATAEEASQRALAVLEAGWPHEPRSAAVLASFDAWLRADGHRRNPGTTADLIAAMLFAAFRDGCVEAPSIDTLGVSRE
jgi:triphosphoribosyl-dephospho-CoA synthase